METGRPLNFFQDNAKIRVEGYPLIRARGYPLIRAIRVYGRGIFVGFRQLFSVFSIRVISYVRASGTKDKAKSNRIARIARSARIARIAEVSECCTPCCLAGGHYSLNALTVRQASSKIGRSTLSR